MVSFFSVTTFQILFRNRRILRISIWERFMVRHGGTRKSASVSVLVLNIEYAYKHERITLHTENEHVVKFTDLNRTLFFFLKTEEGSGSSWFNNNQSSCLGGGFHVSVLVWTVSCTAPCKSPLILIASASYGQLFSLHYDVQISNLKSSEVSFS